MKFSREFQTCLQCSGFPQHWIDSAISYRQLKKCIKSVEAELASIGLDQATLHLLLDHMERQGKGSDTNDAIGESEKEEREPFEYRFSHSNSNFIVPKLLFLVDEATGEPLDASLSPETKEYLHQLAIAEQLTEVRVVDYSVYESNLSPSANSDSSTQNRDNNRLTKLIEVPLTKDSEFFSILQEELTRLAKLQQEEKSKLAKEIHTIGAELAAVTAPDDKKSRKDVQQWRRLFELYLESAIFFATAEQDHGVHTAAQAQSAYGHFLETAQKHDLLIKFKQQSSRDALQHFLAINAELLQSLRFQEINRTAMTKILKKFDKRTSLNAKLAFSTSLPSSLLAGDISKALAAQVSSDILSIVPQFDDYLCPICFTIAHRPIRLSCNHIFCIRCMIIMQRAKKNACPLCREPVVMQADTTNLDEGLQGFLARWFPEEVKQKQKANERALAFEQYGLEEAPGCVGVDGPKYACVVM